MSQYARLSGLQWKPAGLVALFVFYAVLTLVLWDVRGRYAPRGDEEFYLIAASSIWTQGSLDVTEATRSEFETRAIYKRGLPTTPDGKLNMAGVHVVVTPDGAFSVHGLGLPAILAVPFGIAGTTGAKLFLIGLASTLLLIGWRITGYFSTDSALRGWSVVATFVTLPFVPAANQVYPDLPAGVICLFCLVGLTDIETGDGRQRRWPCILATAFLPWLHIKLGAPAVVLALAAMFLLRRRGLRVLAAEGVPLALSLCLLAAYNAYVFGWPFGVYGASALLADLNSVMVFLGLLFDQNQGMFAQSPIFYVGLLFLVPFCSRHRFVGLVTVVLFFALIVPNAMHGNRYGGDSFSGRFGWSAATVLTLPTLYGLVTIGAVRRNLGTAIVTAGAAFQVFEFLFYAVGVQDLYQRFGRPIDRYSIFFGPGGRWLPAFYDAAWAWSHWPNWVVMGIALAVFLSGFTVAARIPFRGRISLS